MRALRVLFIDHYATSPEYPGLSRNFDICANLVEFGLSATLVMCRFNHSLRRYVPGVPEMTGVRLGWTFGTKYNSNSWARELNIITFAVSALIRGLATPADVVLVTIPTLESAFAAYLIARAKRIPLVLNIEDLWPDSLVAMGYNNKLVIGILRRLEQFLYRHADQTLIIAENMRNHVTRSGARPGTLTLLPLGASLSTAGINREQIRAQYGWAPSDVVCGYVGSHGPANSLDTIIDAAAKVTEKHVRFVLFGDGSDKERLRLRAEQLALENLQFMSAVSPREVPSILRGLDVAIATLKDTELFRAARPTKLFEYMEAGLPIVCAIDGEARHLIEEVGAGVFVAPEDAGGLADAVIRLAGDEHGRRGMGNLGRRYIEEFASRPKMAAQLKMILIELCSATLPPNRRDWLPSTGNK